MNTPYPLDEDQSFDERLSFDMPIEHDWEETAWEKKNDAQLHFTYMEKKFKCKKCGLTCHKLRTKFKGKWYEGPMEGRFRGKAYYLHEPLCWGTTDSKELQ